MDAVSLLGLLAGTMGTLLGFGLFFQTKKIYDRKAADEISYVTFAIFFFNSMAWIAYGVASQDWPIVVPNVISLFGVGSILGAAIYYNRRMKH
jgi:uncharacterized protein with PQ loop repeat